MEMKRLNATGLRAAGYDERNRKLVVETTNGTFEYGNVGPEIYRRLMNSPSPASYYKDNIENDEQGFPKRRISTQRGPAPDDIFK